MKEKKPKSSKAQRRLQKAKFLTENAKNEEFINNSRKNKR